MLPHTAYRLSLPKRSICLPLFDAALLLSDAVLSVQSVLQSALYLLRNCNFLIGNCTVWTAVLHCHFCATSGPISPPKRSNCLPLLDVALHLTLLVLPVQSVLESAQYSLRNYEFTHQQIPTLDSYLTLLLLAPSLHQTIELPSAF